MTPLQREGQQRREGVNLAFQRRHPAIAADERRLKKANRAAAKRWAHKREGTAETHEKAARTRQGALARLYESGAITLEQLAASQEIAAEAERLAADVAMRPVSLETRIDDSSRHFGAAFEGANAVRRALGYTRWRAALEKPVEPVFDMIVADIGVTAAARRHAIGPRRAKRLLIAALDLWPETMAAVCREVSSADIAAAQAGLV